MRINKNPQFEKACALFTAGKTKKEVSLTVGITQKTAGLWFKKWQNEKGSIQLSIKNIKTRLQSITANENTPVQDIKDLSYSLDLLTRIKV
jgi:transposase